MEMKSESSVTNSRADAGVSGEMDCILVTSATQMAIVLLRASPNSANDFALAMHERACCSQNYERMDFWLAAMDELARLNLSYAGLRSVVVSKRPTR